jgi:hypothetical protein
MCKSCKCGSVNTPVASTTCHSCSAPLTSEMFKGCSKVYCKFCADDKGDLKSKAEIQTFIARWFMTWQPNITETKALERAALYMKAINRSK